MPWFKHPPQQVTMWYLHHQSPQVNTISPCYMERWEKKQLLSHYLHKQSQVLPSLSSKKKKDQNMTLPQNRQEDPEHGCQSSLSLTLGDTGLWSRTTAIRLLPPQNENKLSLSLLKSSTVTAQQWWLEREGSGCGVSGDGRPTNLSSRPPCPPAARGSSVFHGAEEWNKCWCWGGHWEQWQEKWSSIKRGKRPCDKHQGNNFCGLAAGSGGILVSAVGNCEVYCDSYKGKEHWLCGYAVGCWWALMYMGKGHADACCMDSGVYGVTNKHISDGDVMKVSLTLITQVLWSSIIKC